MDITIKKRIEKAVALKRRQLQSIIDTASSPDEARNANFYIDELTEIELLLASEVESRLVPLETYQKQLAKADFAEMDFDGLYVKIAIVHNYPFASMWMVYMVSIDSV